MAREKRRSKPAWLFALVIAFGLGLGAWWASRPPLTVAERAGGAEPEVPKLPEVAQPDAALVPAEAADAAERIAVSADRAAEVGLESEIVVDGTMLVTDADGAQHESESGSMTLLVLQESASVPEPVAITSGRWTAMVPAGARLSFTDVVLGGRCALVDEQKPVSIPASRRVYVHADWSPAVSLKVRSAETLKDLTGVEVVVTSGDWARVSKQWSRHGKQAVLVSNATSPIDLGCALAQRGAKGRITLSVRASGYCLGEIGLNPRKEKEWVVDLVPGGTVNVLLAGEVPPGAALRARRVPRGIPAHDQMLQGSNRALLTLRPSTYTISVEIGEWTEDPLVLGSNAVEVLAGSACELVIDVAPVPILDKAPLAGTLHVDPLWGEVSPRLTIESMETPADGVRVAKELGPRDLQPSLTSANTWAFDAGFVPLGDYAIEVQPVFFHDKLRVDAGARDFVIRVPAPAIAALRVVDQEGVEVHEISSIFWRSELARGAGSLESVERDPATGRFEIHTPATRIALVVFDANFRAEQTFDLAPGRQELDLVVERPIGIKLVLRCSDSGLAPGHIVPTDVRGPGKLVGSMSTSQSGASSTVEHRLVFSRPGLYRFSVPAIEGFDPVPEQEVAVPESGFAEHVIELVRSP